MASFFNLRGHTKFKLPSIRVICFQPGIVYSYPDLYGFLKAYREGQLVRKATLIPCNPYIVLKAVLFAL